MPGGTLAMKKFIEKKHIFFTVFLFAVLLLGSAQMAYATKYTPQGPLRISRVQQNNEGGECWKCSIATIQAYCLQEYTYNGLTQTYGRPGVDSVWSSDPLWYKVRDINNNSAIWQWDSFDKLPYPMEYAWEQSMSAVLSKCYEQLSQGKPVFIKTDKHASVVIAYNNSSDTLSAVDFTVMEVKLDGSCFVNDAEKWASYAAKPVKSCNTNGPCYLALDYWASRCGGYDGSYGIAWVPQAIGKKLTLTAANGQITKGSSGIYQAGKTIALSVEADQGYVFSHWTSSNGGTFSNAESAACTFTMPDAATTVTANFVPDPVLEYVEWSFTNITNVTKTTAQANAKFNIEKSLFTSLFSVEKIVCYASRNRGELNSASPVSPGSVAFETFDQPTYDTYDGGRAYIKSVTDISGMHNAAGQTLSLQPGETCYVKWVAVVNQSLIHSDIQQFTLPAPSAQWYKIETNTSGLGLFNGWMRYSSSVVMTEAGCFVSPDRNLVLNATRSNQNGTALKIDSVPNGFEYGTIENDRYTCVFYKAPPFDTISSFQSGVTYYYKFYGVTSAGDVAYSSIGTYTPAAATTYALTVKAGTGGSISAGASGNYAAGNVISLIAVPETGYAFSGWTATSGKFSDAASASCSFTMPDGAATVTANFTPVRYTITVQSEAGGSVNEEVSGQYPMNSKINLKATPDEGYTFKRWLNYYGGAFENEFSPETVYTSPAASVTIYAQFEEDVSSIMFDQENYWGEMGSSQQLSLTILPQNMSEQTLSWSSSNPAVATVDTSGVVTIHHMGSAEIRATAPNGIYGTTTVHCLSPVGHIHVVVEDRPGKALDEAIVVEVGQELKWKAIATGTNQSVIETLSAELTDNHGLFEIDNENGTVKAVSSGIGKLTYTYYDWVDGKAVSAGNGASCWIVVKDPADTLVLPQALKRIEEEVFWQTAAEMVVIPDTVTEIASEAFDNKEPLIVLMDAGVERIIADDAFAPYITYIVDTGTTYQPELWTWCDERDWQYLFNGVVEVLGEWSDWSEWSTDAVQSSETVSVETKMQYRIAPITQEVRYTNWSTWSGWKETSQSISDTNLKQQETCPGYGYYYYSCHNCGKHMPIYGNCRTDWGGCGATGDSASTYGDFSLEILPTSLDGCQQWYSFSRYYVTSPSSGKPVFYWPDAPAQPYRTLYRYRTRTSYLEPVVGVFGSWQDEYAAESDSQKVETRTLYRYRTLEVE